MSVSNCYFLTCVQISQEAGQLVCYSCRLKHFPQLVVIHTVKGAGQLVCYSRLLKRFPQFVVIHTVKGFGIVNKADVFLELSYFFDDPTDVSNLISGSSAFSKSGLNIWKVTVHILLKPGLEALLLLACEMSAIV